MFDTVWPVLETPLRALESEHTKADERAVARLLAERLAGVGPKQARNVIQTLGLSRYETPLDSRVAKWLRRLGFPAPVSAIALSDPDYYEFALDAFQELSNKCGIVPCLLDAAIFVSFDSNSEETDA